jgi:hypothetical protein
MDTITFGQVSMNARMWADHEQRPYTIYLTAARQWEHTANVLMLTNCKPYVTLLPVDYFTGARQATAPVWVDADGNPHYS